MPETSQKYKEAEATVRPELRGVFAQFVKCYEFHSLIRHGRSYVSYLVMADMVNDGWMPANTEPAEGNP